MADCLKPPEWMIALENKKKVSKNRYKVEQRFSFKIIKYYMIFILKIVFSA